jgi:hypothetical protein
LTLKLKCDIIYTDKKQGRKTMKKQIKKLDEILNGKATELFNKCLEKEIKEIKKREYLFEDFDEMHDEENFFVFKLKVEEELRNKGYKKNPEVIGIFENFYDKEMNDIFEEMSFENYTKTLWKEIGNLKFFLKYKIKGMAVLVLKRTGRNGHRFAKEKYKKEYEFPY